MNEKDLSRKNPTDFECLRCHACCLQPGFVYLKKGEEETMAAHLGLDPFDFVNRYCELEDRQKLVLKKHPDERCIFLQKGGCQVHEAKPKQCRDFPKNWKTEKSLDYCEGMKKRRSAKKEPSSFDD